MHTYKLGRSAFSYFEFDICKIYNILLKRSGLDQEKNSMMRFIEKGCVDKVNLISCFKNKIPYNGDTTESSTVDLKHFTLESGQWIKEWLFKVLSGSKTCIRRTVLFREKYIYLFKNYNNKSIINNTRFLK